MIDVVCFKALASHLSFPAPGCRDLLKTLEDPATDLILEYHTTTGAGGGANDRAAQAAGAMVTAAVEATA